jgi:hypothetical protein
MTTQPLTESRREGYTTDAVADQLGCARRTIARQLALIRRRFDLIFSLCCHSFGRNEHLPETVVDGP